MQMNQEIDISGVLSASGSDAGDPSDGRHRRECRGGRFLAQHIPHARLAEFPGDDHLPYIGENTDDIDDESRSS
jgi:hypothetical protein